MTVPASCVVTSAGSVTPATGEPRRTLVAGVGNLFLGDDGFGAEVARFLTHRPLPPGVTVTDYGIRGTHLAYDLLDGWEALILIDLVPSRGNPGAVHVIEISGEGQDGTTPLTLGAPDPHDMQPLAVLSTVTAMGGTLPPTVLVGCEGVDTSERIGLSTAVAAAVAPAADAVLRLLSEIPAKGGR